MRKAENSKTTTRRLPTLELIRQRGAAQAAGNQESTPELARLCRKAIKEDLKERKTEVLSKLQRQEGVLLCPPELRQWQDKNDCSLKPKWNDHCSEKENEEKNPRLLL
ncbi:hypothetical protein RB195_024078 [Necator americanus]|uniref:Uncharacterized protein n=1 Tax=Necator americanus TaxID=51031 RepID=A0ABR1EP08_NECAM